MLVLKIDHFCVDCLVSQISRPVAGGTSLSHEELETPFSLCPPHHLCKHGLYFLRLSLGVNFLDLLRAALSLSLSLSLFVLSLGTPLVYMVKPQKDVLFRVTIKMVPFINGQRMDALK